MHDPNSNPNQQAAGLRILATTDLHMHLTAHNYFADAPSLRTGLTRTATLIAHAREEARHTGTTTLLFDNGDALQGTLMEDIWTPDNQRPHPFMRAICHLGYDAIGLGNHDFNHGLDMLSRILRDAPCPVVSSNLCWLGQPATDAIKPFAILNRTVRANGAARPVRIGVLSFLPPQTVQWDAHLLEGRIKVDGIVASARRWTPVLRRSGCDLIVALAHSGFETGPEPGTGENTLIRLAALGDIDAIVSGHTHLPFPGPAYAGRGNVDTTSGKVHGIPVVLPGSAGSHLGLIDVELRPSAKAGVRPGQSGARLRCIAPGPHAPDGTPEDLHLQAALATEDNRTRALARQPVGHTDIRLHSYFSLFAEDRALALVAEAQAAAMRRFLKETEASGLAVLSAAAPCKFGARAGPFAYTDVPAGQIALRHVADMTIFPNDLNAVILTGAQIRDWLDMAAGLFTQVTPGSQQVELIAPGRVGHNFDVLHGLSYEIDLSKPARFDADGTLRHPDTTRIARLCRVGRPVLPDQRFVVALSSYRAGGGGNVQVLRDLPRISLPPIRIRRAVLDHLATCGANHRTLGQRSPWRFSPAPGVSVRVRTSPAAQDCIEELAHYHPRAAGLDADGFLMLDLQL